MKNGVKKGAKIDEYPSKNHQKIDPGKRCPSRLERNLYFATGGVQVNKITLQVTCSKLTNRKKTKGGPTFWRENTRRGPTEGILLR